MITSSYCEMFDKYPMTKAIPFRHWKHFKKALEENNTEDYSYRLIKNIKTMENRNKYAYMRAAIHSGDIKLLMKIAIEDDWNSKMLDIMQMAWFDVKQHAIAKHMKAIDKNEYKTINWEIC